ncbi:transcriptional regulator with XRE-family HTH domain [Nocardiopsis mwathae]|uniref:Transcriptional regulator with XRE-family HTH domain n=1 Tax=Nocardiopsis mwathae TaxID=1472723 RepID=A0A7W9YIH2_9ACTN|nr:helix-turn-helix transcriptional regulator [Nocardiopsis mwathae]MBB6172780.1 transcriptional regulator with XRE-family HTH domain [Nocardiopsis mwathae]
MNGTQGEHAVWRRSGRHSDAYDEARRGFLLGKMVCERRVALGLSQRERAERAGMTQPQVSRSEEGGTTPSIALLERLAEALNADLSIGFTPRNAA